MSSIQKLVRKRTDPTSGKITAKTSYRVFIRKNGLKPITKTFGTKKLAQAYAARIEGDQEAAIALGGEASVVLKSMTLGELIELYIKEYKGNDQSISSRLTWWKDHYGDYKLGNIDRALIRRALRELAAGEGFRGHGRGKNVKLKSTGRPRAPATINRYKASLASVFKFGINHLDLPSNPCRGVPAETENNKRIRFLGDEERKALLSACKLSDWPRLYLLVSMAITTGARKSELLRLRWSNIDLHARRAYVATTKNGEPRVLPLTKDVVQELIRFREPGAGLVFPSPRQPSSPFEFTKPWKLAMDGADIVDFRFHDLRHTAASILAMSGASLLQIADVLGHKSTIITQRYAHLCVNHKQSLIDNVMSKIL